VLLAQKLESKIEIVQSENTFIEKYRLSGSCQSPRLPFVQLQSRKHKMDSFSKRTDFGF
jgi:hypothetical protein